MHVMYYHQRRQNSYTKLKASYSQKIFNKKIYATYKPLSKSSIHHFNPTYYNNNADRFLFLQKR